MKKILSLLVILSASAVMARAFDFMQDSICYRLLGGDSVAVTKRSTDDPRYNGSVVIPATVTYNNATYRVTAIADSAFIYCGTLTDIVVPEGITYVGSRAFADCYQLLTLDLPNSVTSLGSDLFTYCNFTSFTIPEKVTDIPAYMFDLCDALESVSVPAGLKTIGQAAFYGCHALSSINLPDGLLSIGSDAFLNSFKHSSLTVPSSVTTIGTHAFEGVMNVIYSGPAEGSPWSAKAVNGFFDGPMLLSPATHDTLLACSSEASGTIVIPDGVTMIAQQAFQGCTGITSIVVPEGVTYIDWWAFSDCSGIVSATLPSSLQTLDCYAFADCSSLVDVTLPTTVTKVGNGAFYHVPNITYNGTLDGSPWGAKCMNGFVDGYYIYSSAAKDTLLSVSGQLGGDITIPENIVYIGSGAFAYNQKMTSVTIPATVRGFGSGAFSNTFLQSAVIAEGITALSEEMFAYSMSLDSVVFPSTITSISKGAFRRCGLDFFTIPATVDSVFDEAFRECSGMRKLYFMGDSSVYIGKKVFTGCTGTWDVYSYSPVPPVVEVFCFSDMPKIMARLHVPAGSVERYKSATGWSSFNLVETLTAPEAPDATEGQVTVTPSYYSANFVWPASEGVSFYVLTVTKQADTVCSVIFDGSGQLVAIEFAPKKNGAAHAPAAHAPAATAVAGLMYDVTCLEIGTQYDYTLRVDFEAGGEPLVYTGSFATKSKPQEDEDEGEDEALSDIDASSSSVRKILRDGRVIILTPNGAFDASGRRVE